MSGIRVSSLPERFQPEHIKTILQIHFGKACNGGGKIKTVYYPVLGNEAVIIFEDPSDVDTVMIKQHVLEDTYELIVKRLPLKHIFLHVNTELDPDIASILQASEENMDRIRYVLHIDVHYDDSKTRIIGLSGSWYQIEMAWQFIDSLMVEQKKLQQSVQVKMASTQRKQNHKEDEMDIDEDGLNIFDGREISLRQASIKLGERINSEQISLGQYSNPNRWRHKSAELDSDEDEDNRKRHIGKSGTSIPTMSQRTEQSDEELRHEELHHLENVEDRLSNNSERMATEMNGRERSLSGKPEDVYESIEGSVQKYSLNSPLLSDNQVSGHDSDVTWLSPLSTSSFQQRREERRSRHSFSLDSSNGRDDKTSDHFSSLDSQHVRYKYMQKTHAPDRSSSQKGGALERDRTDRFGQSYGTDHQRQNVCTDTDQISHVQHQEGMSSTAQTSLPKQESVPIKCQDENLKFKFYVGRIHVTVLQGDILKERNRGIVNAANGSLLHAAGVAGAIARAAGPEMELECENFIIKHGSLNTTEVMHTSAGGRLNREVTHIIHAVGPIWIGETFKDTFHYELTKTFMNCFIYANDRLYLESLTLPLISSGIFGAPLDECVRCFLDGLLVYSKQGTKTLQLTKVDLIFKDPDSTMLCIAILQQLLDNGIENLTKEAMEMYSVHEIHNSEKARRLGRTQYK
ncbi:hypothetical protein CHS0354_036415 [Potamilus streckersoni]|uniref:Macro domain-containing protein n=1 Tax=Potamilus streckersoni TaxID=2493646 RepID=A0AAE0W3Y6_9BIVA|nr:hypothetical protein CHS0354_036415 [Potamilus streckersoni]